MINNLFNRSKDFCCEKKLDCLQFDFFKDYDVIDNEELDNYDFNRYD